MKVILILLFSLTSFTLWADNSDPNNYFSDRSWTVDSGKRGTLIIKSVYVAEPVHLPNHLSIELKCPKSKKRVWVTKKFKYCGVDAVTIIGNKVELMLADFDTTDSRGYCRIKKRKYLPLPSCK